MEIECIHCGEKIKNPNIERVCCSKRKCQTSHSNLLKDFWYTKYPEKHKEYMRKYYKRNKKEVGGNKNDIHNL